MARKIVYSKGFEGTSDFIYVDLLPEVKRSRQFNVNVIMALTLGVVLSFTLIYIPFRARTEEFEDLNGLNNDLKHELVLTQEEFVGYEIDLSAIAFETQLDGLKDYRVDVNNLLDDISILVENYNSNSTTVITHVTYSASYSVFEITVESTSTTNLNRLNNDFLNLDWVVSSQYGQPVQLQDAVLYRSTFTLGVDRDAE